MAIKLFVGSLPFSTDDDQLAEHFSQVGKVESAKVITDRETGRSRGFGFVEMSSDEEAKAAIDQLNNSEMSGRTIVVNEAKPREDNRGGGGGGGSFRTNDRSRSGGGGGGGRRY